MDKEKEEQLMADIAAAHQEINLLRCRLDATGALILVYAILESFVNRYHLTRHFPASFGNVFHTLQATADY